MNAALIIAVDVCILFASFVYFFGSGTSTLIDHVILAGLFPALICAISAASAVALLSRFMAPRQKTWTLCLYVTATTMVISLTLCALGRSASSIQNISRHIINAPANCRILSMSGDSRVRFLWAALIQDGDSAFQNAIEGLRCERNTAVDSQFRYYFLEVARNQSVIDIASGVMCYGEHKGRPISTWQPDNTNLVFVLIGRSE